MANNEDLMDQSAGTEENSSSMSYTLKAAHSLNIRWTIPAYFSLPKTNAYYLQSSSFTFTNATWCLRLYPNEMFGTFISLVRLRSLVSSHDIVGIFDAELKVGKCVKDESICTKASYCKLIFNECDLEHELYFGKIHKGSGPCTDEKIYIPGEHLVLVCHLLSEESTENDQLLEKCENDCGETTALRPDGSLRLRQMLQCESNLTLRPSTAESIKILWKFPNYLSLPDNQGYSINSPPLDFGFAAWFLKLYPNGLADDQFPGDKDTNISLVRSHSIVKLLHEIVYAFNIVKINEESNFVEYNKFSFKENRELTDVHAGFNDQKRSDLIQFADVIGIIPDGNMTFSAHFFCEKSTLNEEVVRGMSHELDRYKAFYKDFENLFLDGKNHDLILQVKEKAFRVHRNILSIRSQVFETMLTHDMAEKNSGVVNITDCDPEAMEQFLLYVYRGKVDSLNDTNMLGLYYLADKYCMMHLKEECRDFMRNSMSCHNICNFVQLALNHCDESLLEYATEFFVNNTNEILSTTEWMSFVQVNGTVANDLFKRASRKFTGEN